MEWNIQLKVILWNYLRARIIHCFSFKYTHCMYKFEINAWKYQTFVILTIQKLSLCFYYIKNHKYLRFTELVLCLNNKNLLQGLYWIFIVEQRCLLKYTLWNRKLTLQFNLWNESIHSPKFLFVLFWKNEFLNIYSKYINY